MSYVKPATMAPNAREMLGEFETAKARRAIEEIDTLEEALRQSIRTILLMQTRAAESIDA